MQIIRKTDIALIAFFIACAIALIFIFFLAHPVSASAQVIVTVDGAQYLALDLHSGHRHIEIHSAGGINEIVIEGGMVRMHTADCPDQLCVHQMPITRGFQSIVCLPNRVLIELRNVAADDGIDGWIR